MWRQVNHLISQVLPTGQSNKERLRNDADAAAVELSVREPRAAVVSHVELQCLPARASHKTGSRSNTEHLGYGNHVTAHPLAEADTAASEERVPQAAGSASGSESKPNMQAKQPAGANTVASVGSDDVAMLPHMGVVGQGCASHALSSVRLTLSVCCELAASTTPQQQQQLQDLVRTCLTEGTWPAGSDFCQPALVYRLLLEHYFPSAVSSQQQAWQQLQQQQGADPNSLSARLMAAAATAEAAVTALQPSFTSNGSLHGGLEQVVPWLDTLVVCGEIALLQQRHADCWNVLLELARQSPSCCHALQQPSVQDASQCQPTASSDGESDPLRTIGSIPGDAGQPQHGHQQHLQAAGQVLQGMLAAVWPLLHAWAGAVLAAGDTPAAQLQQTDASNSHQQQQEQQQTEQQQQQQQHIQWQQLLTALESLQQQVRTGITHNQPPSQQVAQCDDAGLGFRAQSSSASGSRPYSDWLPAGSGDGSGSWLAQQGPEQHQQLQRQVERLQQLCSTVPVLLQPGDMAEPLPAPTTPPDPLTLVVVMRLAASTSLSWQQALGPRKAGAAGATAAAGLSAKLSARRLSAGDSEHHEPLECPPALSLATAEAATERAGGDDGTLQCGGAQQDCSSRSSSEGGDADALKSPRSSWPDELLSSAQLWPGDVESEDDVVVITREERTLRCWINSVLHRVAAGSTSSGGQAAAGGPAQLLRDCCSADTELWESNSPGLSLQQQAPGSAAAGPLRSCSTGGSMRSAPHSTQQRQAAASLSSSNCVLRSSSAAAADAAAHSSSRLGSGSRGVHSRSISADALGPAAGEPLAGWGGRAVAPGTPTAAAATSGAAVTAGRPLQLGSTGGSISSGGGGAGAAAAEAGVSSVSSLFGPELRSGVLLLEILDMLQPGCVDWRKANRPPFPARTAQLRALENCQLALKIAKEDLGLPLVSMSPRDLVLGRRKIILSLVYQLMRFNTMQMLESISAVHSEQQEQQEDPLSNGSAGTTAGECTPKPADSIPPATAPVDPLGLGRSSGGAGQSSSRVNICSSSKKQRSPLAITEQDILDWANKKLQQVKPLAGKQAAADAPVIKSFKDPVLSSGVVLLQLLHVLVPELVNLSYVTPGHTAAQRQSNARYALSLADKMGCSLFLVWEDLVDPPQPRMVLVLLASLMAQDLQRQQLC